MNIAGGAIALYLLARYVYFRRCLSRAEKENRLIRLELIRRLPGPISDERWSEILRDLEDAFENGFYIGPSKVKLTILDQELVFLRRTIGSVPWLDSLDYEQWRVLYKEILPALHREELARGVKGARWKEA